jgi:hypothetical protein
MAKTYRRRRLSSKRHRHRTRRNRSRKFRGGTMNRMHALGPGSTDLQIQAGLAGR